MNIEELSHDEMIDHITNQSTSLEKIIDDQTIIDLLLDEGLTMFMTEEILKVWGIPRCRDEIETGSGSILHSQQLRDQWWLIWEEYPEHLNSKFSRYGGDEFPKLYLSASPYGWDLDHRIHGAGTLHKVICYLLGDR
jgi:hypothetical protein